MAEKRLFHATIKNPDNNKTDYEAFYQAHTVGDVRQDAGNRHVARGGNSKAFTVEHENLTKRPTEFYDRLREAENRSPVTHEKVKGLGHRWEVQKDEDASPFGKAADDNGGIPPSLQGSEYGPEDPPTYYETLDDLLPEENAGDIIVLHSSPHRAMESFPCGVDYENIDPLQKLPMEAIGGFYVPTEETTKKKDSGKLNVNTGELPKVEDLDAKLEELRKDPSTYEQHDEEEITVAGSSAGHSGYLFI